MMSQFPRIERLPPYVFNTMTQLKNEARANGEDIIDFGMGNPDQPTPPHIVNKLIEVAQRPDSPGTSPRSPRGSERRAGSGA
jgi:alanine-synthesizing transaminase